MKIYEETFKVTHTESDAWLRMTPAAILRRVQSASTQDAEDHGLSEDVYVKTDTVFLLSRVSLLVNKIPMVDDVVTITTKAYAQRRAVYNRLTMLMSQNGNILCQIDARWVLVSRTTGHILRSEPVGFKHDFLLTEPEVEHEFKFKRPEGVNGCAPVKWKAAYSLCDKNKHINNANYADIICDSLPLEKLEKNPVRRMVLSYRNEIRLGGHFDVVCAPLQDGSYYIAAEQAAKRSFEALVEFFEES